MKLKRRRRLFDTLPFVRQASLAFRLNLESD
jgi:hypothetical protein